MRTEFSMEYIFRGQRKMPNEKSKARKACQSFHTKQFVQPANQSKTETILFLAQI